MLHKMKLDVDQGLHFRNFLSWLKRLKIWKVLQYFLSEVTKQIGYDSEVACFYKPSGAVKYKKGLK